MWLLSRWNFKTVKGDILAGVYDKYLDVAKRRALGEVYTRPEICRYMLARCNAKPSDTVLDPACGSGTFLVEHLHGQLERLRSSNALNVEAVQSVLQRIYGLDINPFSVVLSQIQMLWQLLDVFAYLTPDEQKNTAKALIPHIMIEGGHTSLDTYDQPMEAQGERELDLGQADSGGAKFSGAFGTQVRRRLKAIAMAQYDVVVAAAIRAAHGSSALAEFDAARAALDRIAAEALGLTDEQLEYIATRFRDDPFLSQIRPMWAHRGLHVQGFRDNEAELRASS